MSDWGRWYVVQTKDNSTAEFHLRAQEYDVYAPKIEVRGPKGLITERPMFGSYIFVFFDMDKNGWQNIWYTRGVRRLMCMHDEEPSKVPKGFVEKLREQASEGAFKIQEQGPIKVGETLKILEGPLTGMEGLCSFSTGKRVGILLHLLNRETKIYLSSSAVARI